MIRLVSRVVLAIEFTSRVLGLDLLLDRRQHLRHVLRLQLLKLLVPVLLVEGLHQLVLRTLTVLRLAPGVQVGGQDVDVH